MKPSQAKPLARIEIAQLRGARALLGWSQQQLADRAGISCRTIAAIESAETKPKPETLRQIAACLQEAGIKFSRTRDFWPQIALRPPTRANEADPSPPIDGEPCVGSTA